MGRRILDLTRRELVELRRRSLIASVAAAEGRTLVATLLALVAKEIGVDAHHLGDAGIARAANPDLVYS